MGQHYQIEEYNLKDMQTLELKLFDELRRVCDSAKIPYFLAYGTLLGAARHKGFIPWDDDIDVFVFARDLDKLRDAMDRELDKTTFFYQCQETDPEFNMTITRLRLNGTTALNIENADRDMHQGVFIDIYPLHEVAPNKFGRLKQKCWSMIDCLLTVGRPPLNHGFLGKCAYHVGMLLFDHSWIRTKARKERNRYLNVQTPVLCSLCSGWSTINREFPTAMFTPSHLPFEGRDAMVPLDWDDFLKMRYGNWSELPPEDQRHGSHTIYFFDPDHSYERYRGTKYLLTEKGA